MARVHHFEDAQRLGIGIAYTRRLQFDVTFTSHLSVALGLKNLTAKIKTSRDVCRHIQHHTCIKIP